MIIQLEPRRYDIFEDYDDIIEKAYEKFLNDKNPDKCSKVNDYEDFIFYIFFNAKDYPQYFTKEDLERWEIFAEAKERYFSILEKYEKECS